MARLMENPEFIQALSRQQYGRLDARFGELFRELNLSVDELAAFKRLLVEKEAIALDVVTVSEALPGGPLAPEALRLSVRGAQAEVEQAIHQSLGSERYAVYREYERTRAHRATVARLEERLSYTQTPLASDPAESLVKILAATSPAAANEPAPVLSVVVRTGVPEAVPLLPTNAATGRVTDEIIAQSESVLVPAQLQALRELQEEQQAAARTAELIRQAAPVEASRATATFLLQ